MSDKLSDIEPCRFCGSNHVEVWSDAFVHCWACAADGPVYSSAQEAIAAWNRPTAPSPAGWKSVPIEATDEIIAALQKHCGVLLTDDMEINVGSRYTACEYALHCAWKEALAVSPATPAEPLSEDRKQEIAKSRFTGAVDICKALQCIDDVLKAAPAISESEDAVAWQVRRADGRIDGVPIQWEHCTKELYDATLATGRYAGYENGPRCEVRELVAARKGEKS